MKHIQSPLRYPGGKGRISGYFSHIIKCNRLENGHYAEPYAGGAGVALSLLLNGYVEHIHINDLNIPLYSFWHSVLYESEDLCRKIRRCKISVEAWKRHKYKLNNSSDYSMLDVGFAFLFLNRTNRSGIINGGIIGGYSQSGDWKMDCRFNKNSLIEKIRRIASRAANISLYNLDAEVFLTEIVGKLKLNTLVYIDPPYFEKGQRLYDNYYKDSDHKKLAETIKLIKQPWVVSYDNVLEIKNNFKGFRKLEYFLSYSAGNKYEGSELMIYSENLIIPKPNKPLNLKAA